MFAGKGMANLQYSHIVVPTVTTPYIDIYGLSNTATTKLSSPASLPSGWATGADLTRDGRYLGVVSSSTPYVLFYERQGDTYTKLPDPASMPPNPCFNGAWDPQSVYFCATDISTGTNKFSVYKRSSNTMTLVGGISKVSGFTGCYGVAWDRTGTLMAIGLSSATYLAVYYVDRATDTFTQITNPCDTYPPALVNAVSFSSGNSLATSGDNFPGGPIIPPLNVYNITYNGTATSFAKIANPTTSTGSVQYSVDWIQDGSRLAVTYFGLPGAVTLAAYNRSGDTLSLSQPLPPIGTGGLSMLKWNPDGSLVFVGSSISPFFTVYQTTGNTFTKLGGADINPSGSVRGQLGIFPRRG
jgi:hypothetical protein